MDSQSPCEKYTIAWEESASATCLRAWADLLPHHSLAVTRAEQAATCLLAHAPLRYADALTKGLFKLQVAPLSVYFEIAPECTVFIRAVRLVPRRDATGS